MTSCYWTCWEYFMCCVCMWRWRYGIIQKSTIRCIKCISPALLTSNSMRLELKSDTNTHTLATKICFLPLIVVVSCSTLKYSMQCFAMLCCVRWQFKRRFFLSVSLSPFRRNVPRILYFLKWKDAKRIGFRTLSCYSPFVCAANK